MRLIDADALIYHFGEVDDNDTKRWDLFITAEEMEEQPTVDAVPVIRCKDCKWFGRVDSEMGWCNGFGDGQGVPAEGYCHNAERRE